MTLDRLGLLWLGRMDPILQYVPPARLILLATTNKRMLGYVQGYFSRIAKKYPCWRLDKKEEEEGSHWDIKDIIMQKSLIWIRSRIFGEIILKPKTKRRGYRGLYIYGWVIWDASARHEFYGRYPTWILLLDNYDDEQRILKFIPYR